MGNWQSRDTKLRQRRTHKEFSKPFKKKRDKDKIDIQQKIREAKRHKYDYLDGDDESSYE
tara:strand:- start:337 stop:516 length:180 start_codon:yes stop_codon:yes gene_type:complete